MSSRLYPGAESEWHTHWPMLLAATLGVSFAAIPIATLGLFMAPLQQEFGWNRTEVSGGLTIFALISLPLMPFAGLLVDRYGARRTALPGLLFSSLAFASFALLGGSLVQWLATWVIFTLLSLTTSILVWSSAVSTVFRRNRGLAIALVLSGNAFTQAVAPILSRWLIDEFGWRTAYVAIATGWGGTVLLVAIFLFRNPVTDDNSASPASAMTSFPGGLTVTEALRNLTLYRIALATFLQTTLSAAMLVHLVPLLTSIGVSRAAAASYSILFAVTAVLGKLLTGWLVDRLSAAWLPALCYAGPAVTCVLLLQGKSSPTVLLIAIAVLGYCSGASLQLTTYLTTRYAGLRHFATIFGFVSTVMALAGGLGPVIGGMIYDRGGSYHPLLAAGCVTALLAGISALGLGRYPDFNARRESVAN